MKMSGENLSEEMKPIHVKHSEKPDATNYSIPTNVNKKNFATKKTLPYLQTSQMMVVFICIGIAGLSSYHFIAKYYNNSIYIETTQHFHMKDTFPAVTFCLRRSIKRYCDLDINLEIFGQKSDQTCTYDFPSRSRTKEIITEDNHEKSWQNGVFDITCLRGRKCKKSDISQDFIKTTSKYHACVTWNYDGRYSNTQGEIELSVTVRDNKFNGRVDHIEAIIHDSTIDGSVQTNFIPLFVRQAHYLKFTKSTINRLFENCQKTKAPDIFPGDYSLSGCFMSVSCLQMLEKCEGVYDICRYHLPLEMQNKYIKNNTISSIKHCLTNMDNSSIVDASQCKLPCHEILFDVESFSYDANEGFNQLSVMLQNKWRHGSKELTERYTHDIYDLISTIGSWIFIAVSLSTILYLCKKIR